LHSGVSISEREIRSEQEMTMFGNTYIFMMPPSQNQGYQSFGNFSNPPSWQGSNPAFNVGNGQAIGDLFQSMSDIINLLGQLLSASSGNSALNNSFGGVLANPNTALGSNLGYNGYNAWLGNDPNSMSNINFNGINNGGFNLGLINNDLSNLFNSNSSGLNNSAVINPPVQHGKQKPGRHCRKSFRSKLPTCDKSSTSRPRGRHKPEKFSIGSDYKKRGGKDINNTGINTINFNGKNNGGTNISIINNYYYGETPSTKAPEYKGGTLAMFQGYPYLKGFDGEKYDVQGANNKYYNMLSDQNVQFNARFESWGA
jgi:hypothetical protein